ncbi:MAG: hypothetical protein KC656_16150, partial [Myxococcales bacterium]|nr:hypothetical protein [Myxococcales bacterium]
MTSRRARAGLAAVGLLVAWWLWQRPPSSDPAPSAPYTAPETVRSTPVARERQAVREVPAIADVPEVEPPPGLLVRA